MFTVEDVIHLPIPMARVGRLLADIDRYQEWHPFVRLARVPGKPDKVVYTHRRKGKDFLTVEADLVRCELKEGVAWRVAMPRFLELEEVFAIEKEGQGTRLAHRMICSGVCSSLIRGRLRKGLLDMLVVTDASLRRHVKRASTVARYSYQKH